MATGKSDPLVEVFTTPNFRYATRHINNTLEPVWNETFYLPVLEKDQVGGLCPGCLYLKIGFVCVFRGSSSRRCGGTLYLPVLEKDQVGP